MPKNIREMHSQQEIINWVYDPVGNFLRTNTTGGGGGDININVNFPNIIEKMDEMLAEIAAFRAEQTDSATNATVNALSDRMALLLGDIKTEITDGFTSAAVELANLSSLVATETTLVATKSVLEAIRDSPSPNVFVEGTLTTGQDVSPAGAVFTVTGLHPLVNFNRVYIRQIFGSATKFRAQVLSRDPRLGSITDLDIVYDNKDSMSPGFNAQNRSWDHIIYERLIAKNAYGAPEFYVRIIPDIGTSNQYLILLNGFKCK